MKKTLFSISLFTSLNLLAVNPFIDYQHQTEHDRFIERIKHELNTRFSAIDLPYDQEFESNISNIENDNQHEEKKPIRKKKAVKKHKKLAKQYRDIEIPQGVQQIDLNAFDNETQHQNGAMMLSLIDEKLTLNGQKLFRIPKGSKYEATIIAAINSLPRGNYKKVIYQLNTKLKPYNIQIINDSILSIRKVDQTINSEDAREIAMQIALDYGFKFNTNYIVHGHNVQINDQLQFLVDGVEYLTFNGKGELDKKIAALALLIQAGDGKVSWLDICNAIKRNPEDDKKKDGKKKQNEYRYKFIQLLRNDIAASPFTIKYTKKNEDVLYFLAEK